MFKVKIYNIKYDTDGEDVELPTEMEMYINTNDEDMLPDLISDAISNETQFCHFGFEYDILER